jgi:hypothetical protein
MAKWEIEGWGAAQGQIREAYFFLCKGKGPAERHEIAEEIVGAIRSLARGDQPAPLTDPLYDRGEHEREVWARGVADRIVAAAMLATERSGQGPLPTSDQVAMLREITRKALWHMPNAVDEARNLTKWITVEGLRQPHPGDKPLGEPK